MEVREVHLEAVSEEGNWCRQMEAQSSQVQFKSSQVDPLRHLRPLPSATAGFRRAHSKGFRMVVSIVLFCIYWLDLFVLVRTLADTASVSDKKGRRRRRRSSSLRTKQASLLALLDCLRTATASARRVVLSLGGPR